MPGKPSSYVALCCLSMAMLASVCHGDSVQTAIEGASVDSSVVTLLMTQDASGGPLAAMGSYVSDHDSGAFIADAAKQLGGPPDRYLMPASTNQSHDSAQPILVETFEDDDAASRGWYDNVSWTTTSAVRRSTGSRSLELAWAPGATTPTFGGAARFEFTATTQVYVSYWVRYSDNWIGSGKAYHPHEFQLLTNADGRYAGPAFTRLTTYIEHLYGPNGGIPLLGISDARNISLSQINVDLTNVTESRAAAGCNGSSDGHRTQCYPAGGGRYGNGKSLLPVGRAPAFLPTPGPSYKGNWRHVEVIFRMNTIAEGIGQLDGLAQYWLDGRLLIDERAVLFRTGAQPNLAWTQFLIAPYIGDGSPIEQRAWIDDLVLATARPF